MSLVNDALNKARSEAGLQEAAETQEIVSPMGTPDTSGSGRSYGWLVPVGLVVVFAAIGIPAAYYMVQPPASATAAASATVATASPAPKPPSVTTPTPPAPKPVVVAPRPPAPKPVVLAPTPAPPVVVVPAPPAPKPVVVVPVPTPAPPVVVTPTPPAPKPVVIPPVPAPAPRPPVAVAVVPTPAPPTPPVAPPSPPRVITPRPPAPAPVKVPARPAPTPPATAGNFNIEYVQVLELPGMPKLTLGGIAWSDHTQIAIINGRTITPGSAFGDIEVVAIERRRVKLRAGRQTVYLRMK